MIARIGWVLPSITISLSTILHIISGEYRAFPFFISETDYPGLQRIIFTGGLCVTGILVVIISWKLFAKNKSKTRWYWMELSMLSGVFAGINISLMSFMDMYDHLDMHITTSMNVFYFGLGWCFTTHLAMKHGNEKGKRFRYASVSLGFIAFTIMMTAMTLAINEHPSFLETNDMDLIQSWVNWAAPMEYLLVISFILTLKSFEIDIQGQG